VSSSLRRGALAASAIVFSIVSLAACGAGNHSQTLEIRPDNAAIKVGNIKLQNVIVVTQPDLQSTGAAAVAATIFNNGTTDQTLQSIVVAGTNKTAQLSPAKGQSLTIPAHGSLIIGGKNNASAVLPSSREAIQDGNAQKVTFTFSQAGDVSLRALVVPATSYFGAWGPSQIPSPSASVSATGSVSPAPGSTASGKPSKNKNSASPSVSAGVTGSAGAAPTGSASASAGSSGH
jgi:hypothetical protein